MTQRNDIEYYREIMRHDLLKFGYVVCKDLTPDKTECNLHKDINEFHISKPRLAAIISPRGHAKFIALDNKVLTSAGWIAVSEIKTGDIVFGSDGKKKNVVGTSDVIYKDTMYKLSTKDGRELTVSDDHLWTVRLAGGDHYTTTTQDMIDGLSGLRVDDEPIYAIDCPRPIEFDRVAMSCDPYCFGLLLCSVPEFELRSYKDDISFFRAALDKYNVSKIKCCKDGLYDFNIYKLADMFAKMGGGEDCVKHIRKMFLTGSVEQRIAFLRGLMDINGTLESGSVVEKGVSYINVPGKFVSDVIELVRGLGGIAKEQFYGNDYNEYRLIKITTPMNPFLLKCKSEKWTRPEGLWNTISDIKKVDGCFCKCIKVDSDDELFVAQDYLLTHNTTWSSTIGVAHDVAYDSEDVIVLIKKTFAQATTDLRNIVNVIKYNTQFRKIYGARDFIIDRQERVYIYNPETSHKTWIEVKGAGQSLRGLVVHGKRPSKMLLDDFEDENNTTTVEQRQHVREWISAQVMPSLDPKKGKLLTIGTVVHYDSWLFNLWENYQAAKVEKREYPWEVIFHQMVEDGEPIWPERFTPKYIKELEFSYRELGQIDKYYQEYFNIPFNKEDAQFTKDMITYYSGIFKKHENLGCILEIKGIEVPVNVIVGIDPSAGSGGDYTGIIVLAIDEDGERYLIEAMRLMIKPGELVEKVFELNEKYSPLRIVIEEQAMQVIMTYWLKSEMIKRNIFIPLIGEKVAGRVSKEERLAQALQPIYSSGVMHHKNNMVDIEEELFTFPKGRHDDILDALYFASKYAMKPHGKSALKRSISAMSPYIRKGIDWMTGARYEDERR